MVKTRSQKKLADKKVAEGKQDCQEDNAEARTKVSTEPNFNGTAVGKHGETLLNKVSLNNGYGDFSMYVENINNPVMSIPNINKNDQSLEEFDGFVRSGKSPGFMSLPMEIRKHILELLCAPFFAKNPETSFLEIELHRMQKITKAALNRMPQNGKDWEYWRTLEQNFTQKRRFPRRKSSYLVQVFPHLKHRGTFVNHTDNNLVKELGITDMWEQGLYMGMDTGMGNCCHDPKWALDLGMLKLIESLSQVCRGFRKELAAVFWAKIKINYCVGEGNLLLTHLYGKVCVESAVVNFLHERPSLRSSIRTLALNAVFVLPPWDESWDDSAQPEGWEEHLEEAKAIEFTDTCQYVTNVIPHLECLEIRLSLREDQLPNLLALSGEFVYLSALKTVLVSKSFKVVLHVDSDSLELEDISQDEEGNLDLEDLRNVKAKIAAELKEEWIRPITEALMPDCITLKAIDLDYAKLTDKEKYLEERKKCMAEAGDTSKDDWPYNFPLGEVEVMMYVFELLL